MEVVGSRMHNSGRLRNTPIYWPTTTVRYLSKTPILRQRRDVADYKNAQTRLIR